MIVSKNEPLNGRGSCLFLLGKIENKENHMDVVRYGNPAFPMRLPAWTVGVAILTSVRDVGACDLNGKMVSVGSDSVYMKGIIEHIIEASFHDDTLSGCLEVVSVITDDTERDLQGSEYPVRPTEGRQWLHPLGLLDCFGKNVAVMTENIPSDFRLCPKNALAERARLKRQFEQRVLENMRAHGASILISDHYMARLEHLIGAEMGLYGRVLNIHPAVTLSGHPFCFRGPTPTTDAIRHAGKNPGTKTGASLHIVNRKIDDGPLIALTVNTPVYEDDSPELLRLRNYRDSKLPLFVEGMKHYIQRILPYVDHGSIDLSKLTPLA